jgi:membrane fusion protein (multidrug efflux system)
VPLLLSTNSKPNKIHQEMKKKQAMKWAMVLGAVLMMSACGSEQPQPTPSSFETLVVKKQNITIPVKFSAKMKGETDVMVTPQVSGQLVKICVKEGDLVNRGQTLFVIDSRTARADLEAAQANLLAAQASENSAKLEYQSKKNLFERNIVSRYVLDNAHNSYKQAQAGVAQARAAVNSAQVNLSFCTITASVSGVIGEIPVRMGDQVSPGTQLTILSGNQNMDAEFSITENLLEMMIQSGVKASEIQKHLAELPDVTFVMKNGTKYEHKGRVTRMTGVVNATTGTIAAKATFPNPTGLLYSGIQGTVVIPNDMKDVIVIPQVAVVKLQDRQQVYKVLADSTATAVEVTTEDVYNGKDYIVTSGLKVGDKIVTVGANNVHEGQKVLFPKAPKTQK